jgi:hypothetical protein
VRTSSHREGRISLSLTSSPIISFIRYHDRQEKRGLLRSFSELDQVSSLFQPYYTDPK